ncbi:hypothetical protein [Saccharothrix texasensis]|uniref:Uncharacterized protein n=1 Tax=Saccharothrix texasensis TaxID=103734 RepID=A0A3N1HAU5_9PSEU|nr:hypothetical protein [Saccharothrix texasensis]ROP39591.1 hypothetical protein EDD40_4981 [Saccharothrix texasensis]
MTDIKQSLATAFEDEPPLGIDKAAIVRDGRRKAALRRGYTGAALLATVVAVAVPALLWSGAGGGGGGAHLPPAAELSSTAPSSPPVVTGTSAPGTEASSNPGSGVVTVPVPPPPKPVTERRAAELSAVIAASGAIPADARGTAVPRSALDPSLMEPWEFYALDTSGYLSRADVTSPAGRGSVLLHLHTFRESTRCDPGDTRCQVRQYAGRAVTVSTQEHDGMIRVTVSTAAPDGTVVSAQASNTSDNVTPDGPAPPLTWEQLAKIVTVPGLVF